MKKIILLIIVSVIFTISLHAQVSQKINLPEGYGSMIADIATGNGYIFTYTPDGINIFDTTNNSFIQKIEFDTCDSNYGKFNPVFFDSRLMVRDQNFMVYSNETNHKYLYVLTPSLKLLIINTSSFIQTWRVSLTISKTGEEYLDNILNSQNGRAILKYDESNKRLFLLVDGKDKNNNCTGNFHTRINLFAFYNIDYTVNPDSQTFLNLHFIRKNTPDDQPGDQINNYVFFNKNNNDYLAIVRLGIYGNVNNNTAVGYIDFYKITGQDIDSLENDHINIPLPGATYNKMGEMLIIPEIDKIVLLPYKFFTAVVQNPVFCVADYSNPENVSHQIINSPSKKILSAVYLNQNNDLIVGYEPDSNDVNPLYQNTNLAVYHYNNSTDLFELTPSFTFLSDDSNNSSPFDFNSPLSFTKLNNSTALICKKDEIGKIEFNGNTYNITDNLLDWNAENNFFEKSAIANNKVFICNYVANGIEIYNINNNSFESNIRTGYPVYKSEANSDGSIILLYSTLNTYNAGLYAYNTLNETVTHINPNGTFTAAIGDCKYNKFTDEFVITELYSESAKIIRLDANTLTKTGEKVFASMKFSKELFISPEGYLYVVAINKNQTNKPQIIVLDATDFSTINTINDITDFSTYDLPFAFYSAHFAYNSYDNSVNVLLTIQEKKLLPYNSVSSNLYGKEITNSIPPPSKLIVISNNHTKSFDYNFDDYAVKIICPYTKYQNKSSQYFGKYFVIGENFYMINYINNYSVTTIVNDNPFIDVVYDAHNDILFALKERYYINGNDTCEEHRQFEIWKVTMTDNFPFVNFEKFNGDGLLTDGQVAGMFYNPYDTRVYVYKKTDAEKLGTGQESLMSFSYNNPTWQIVELGNKTYFPDYDHTLDDSHYFMNNDIAPYIDPYQNKIYLPNGGHSNVSVVEFEANEPLNLRAGTTWFSFPRLASRNEQGNEGSDVALSNNITPQNFLSTEDDKSFLINVPIGSVIKNRLLWDNNFGWDVPNSQLKIVNSLYGYKITLKPDENRTLFLKGTVEDPLATVDLKYSDGNGTTHIDNWIGYFLYREQNVFDALGIALKDIFSIQHQNYSCWRYHYPVSEYCATKSTSDYAPGTWICDGNPVLKYGDMIVVKTFRDINNFQWQQTGATRNYPDRPQPGYYVYEEKPDYSTFVIELDTTQSNPVEIGAFVNNTCIGSTAVLTTDSVVVLRGYLTGQNNDSATFEEHYASYPTKNKKVDQYYVINPYNRSAEKRSVKVGERKSYYLVSFNRKKNPNPHRENKLFLVDLYPNPASKNLTLQYNLVENEKVLVTVLDITGREVFKSSWQQTKGEHQSSIDTHKLKNGMYLLQLSAGNQTVVKRFLINK